MCLQLCILSYQGYGSIEWVIAVLQDGRRCVKNLLTKGERKAIQFCSYNDMWRICNMNYIFTRDALHMDSNRDHIRRDMSLNSFGLSGDYCKKRDSGCTKKQKLPGAELLGLGLFRSAGLDLCSSVYEKLNIKYKPVSMRWSLHSLLLYCLE